LEWRIQYMESANILAHFNCTVTTTVP